MNRKVKGQGRERCGGLWAHLPADSAIRAWAADLRRVMALGDFDPRSWALAGHAVVIEHDDPDEVANLLDAVARECNMSLFFVARERVATEFDQWLDQVPEGVPTIVYLEPGQWVGGSPENGRQSLDEPMHDEGAAYRFRRTFASLLDSGITGSPVVFVTTLGSICQLDPELCHAGRFDRWIKLPTISDAVRGCVFLQEAVDLPLEEACRRELSRLGAVLRCDFPDRARRLLLLQALRRRAWRESRPVGMRDIVEFSVYSTGDEDVAQTTASERHCAAVHEAGHALISWLGSRDRSAPVYTSIKSRGNTLGVVVVPHDAYERSENDRTYADRIQQIRVSLAGRAAEHLVFGSTEISAQSAQEDLERASKLAMKIFGAWGLPPDPASDAQAGANLLVLPNEPSVAGGSGRLFEELSRQFLRRQFLVVLETLRRNRELFDRIVAALIEKGVLFQEELRALEPSFVGLDAGGGREMDPRQYQLAVDTQCDQSFTGITVAF